MCVTVIKELPLHESAVGESGIRGEEKKKKIAPSPATCSSNNVASSTTFHDSFEGNTSLGNCASFADGSSREPNVVLMTHVWTRRIHLDDSSRSDLTIRMLKIATNVDDLIDGAIAEKNDRLEKKLN